jgi:hypothetical protein
MMNWRSGSDLGLGIREIALFLTAFLIILGYFWSSNKEEFGWQLLLTAAGAVFSIWVTLVIIEHAIKKDREDQWQKVKSLTYMTIINDIRYIVTKIPLDTGNATDCINLINGEINYPDEFTTNIIYDLAKEIEKEYSSEENSEENSENLYHNLVYFY